MNTDEKKVELAKKKAKSLVENGSLGMATLDETVKLSEKVDELLSREFPEMPKPVEEVSISNFPEFPTNFSINNLPEVQKVEVTNFPKQDAPIVNVEAPVVNVEAPIVEMNNEEVVAELKNISEILSKEEEGAIDRTEIVNKKGEVVDLEKLLNNLGDRIGNIKISGGGGASFPTQSQADLARITKNYATQIDDSSTASVTYIGKADIGSATSLAVWQIQKIDESTSPTTFKWADGNDSFDNIWNNRTSITYV